MICAGESAAIERSRSTYLLLVLASVFVIVHEAVYLQQEQGTLRSIGRIFGPAHDVLAVCSGARKMAALRDLLRWLAYISNV